MKIGFKGFDKDLKCLKEQFEIGKTYTKDPQVEKPRTCSTDGWHYCNDLQDVYRFYKLENGNRFCEIEVLGNFTDDTWDCKSTTTSFRIIRELSWDETYGAKVEEKMRLELVRAIQKRFPEFHIGGSVGLYLHGVRLDRFAHATGSDLDMVCPNFVLPEGQVLFDDGEEHNIEYMDAKASANDFDETFVVDGTKVDLRIDPKQRYEIIEHRGFKYKVSPLITILEAKMRYALGFNGEKHRRDIENMVVREPNKVLARAVKQTKKSGLLTGINRNR